MNENMCDRCPGCGRHCRRGYPHCEYGADYFRKQEGKAPSHGKISQDAFLTALYASDQISIDELLNHLSPRLRKEHAY